MPFCNSTYCILVADSNFSWFKICKCMWKRVIIFVDGKLRPFARTFVTRASIPLATRRRRRRFNLPASSSIADSQSIAPLVNIKYEPGTSSCNFSETRLLKECVNEVRASLTNRSVFENSAPQFVYFLSLNLIYWRSFQFSLVKNCCSGFGLVANTSTRSTDCKDSIGLWLVLIKICWRQFGRLSKVKKFISLYVHLCDESTVL